MSKKFPVLFICGSLNQTKMMHQIAMQMEEIEDIQAYFTPYYADGFVDLLARAGLLHASVLGGRHRRDTLRYLKEHHLLPDMRGKREHYDLVVTCSDLIVQKNIRGKRLVLVQEGITEPEGFAFQLVKYLRFPRYLANTAATGLSDKYDIFCVASEGYKKLFVKKGVRAEKMAVTGIPNFDNLQTLHDNDFPYHNYVLVATSPLREIGQFDYRPAFIKHCLEIANGRTLIFKLHPMEKARRAWREIHRLAPQAKIYIRGNTDHMIANASVVITQRSTCTFVALALGKEVHSYLDLQTLRELLPIQNAGTSAAHIAVICRQVLHNPQPLRQNTKPPIRSLLDWKILQG
jgi:hypothetical protein